MTQPDYLSYTTEELRDVLKHIDHEAWPERVSAIMGILKARQSGRVDSKSGVSASNEVVRDAVHSIVQVIDGTAETTPVIGVKDEPTEKTAFSPGQISSNNLETIYKTPKSEINDKRKKCVVYSPRQIFLGTALGGPLAAIYYLALNFRNMDNANGEQRVLMIGGALTFVLLLILLILPFNFPGIVLSLVFAFFASKISVKYQFNDQENLDGKFDFQSNWLVFLVSIISAVVIIAAAFLILFVIYSVFDVT